MTQEKLTNGAASPTAVTAAPTVASVVAADGAPPPRRSDNMRDIGTWSNEQAAQRGHPQRGNTRFAQQQQTKSAAADEWENDEEWQGDLTKTQIFTSSQAAKRSDGAQAPSAPHPPTTSFPIGHFDAEEAAQNIKKAVGIGLQPTKAATGEQPHNLSKSSTVPMAQTGTAAAPTAKPVNTTTGANIAQNRVAKIQSVKPPPPSTKIPKSAVVMPDGSSSTSGFSLDVQFGIDSPSKSFKIIRISVLNCEQNCHHSA